MKKITDITPETNVAALLDTFPELEEVFVKIAPEFRKLRNPVLRKTLAMVTTLRQAAKVADTDLGIMVNTLRRAAGFDETEVKEAASGNNNRPGWAQEDKAVLVYDARTDLATGSHPAGRVSKEVRGLNAEEVYLLITPFLPAPLIDILKKDGNEVWSYKEDENTVLTFVKKV